MALFKRSIVALVVGAVLVCGSLVPMTAQAHDYYGTYYCWNGTKYRQHWHGAYDVAGRETHHFTHAHAVGICY